MHRIYQKHHIPPDEFHAKEWRFKAFMYASEELVIEEEEKERKKAKK